MMMTKYVFSIRTRSGHRVDNIAIQARDQADGERRLIQMYPRSQVLTCHAKAPRGESLNVEGIITLVSEQPAIPLPEFLKKSGTG